MADPLRSYSFVPWLRHGIGNAIAVPDTLGTAPGQPGRVPVDVTLSVNGAGVSTPAEMVGPGDVIGLNPRAIIRTEPRADTSDHEANYLAFCEFYDEDFPWRYSPAAPVGDRLRPWLALVVVTETEFEVRSTSGPLDAVRFTADLDDLFPPVAEAWAWAHVQIHRDVTEDGGRTAAETRQALASLLDRNPDLALSRVLCPRRLTPLTPYMALLVPAFEAGRLAGLGASAADIDAVGNQQPSWVGGDPTFPAYHRWEFGTGERGDFESLVRRLRPRPVPPEVGQRSLDVSQPGFGVRGLIDLPTVALEGALRRPGAEPRPATWPPPDALFIDDLVAVSNAEADRLSTGSSDAPNAPDRDSDGESEDPGASDPIIGPPIHGRWHAKVDRVNPSPEGWVDELNLDPRARAAAGVGGRVVRADQENLMARAWAQLGDVLEANRRIRWAQVALAASQRMFVRHIAPRSAVDRIGVTAPVHQRLRTTDSADADSVTAEGEQPVTTWRARLGASHLTPAGRSVELRRLVRGRGRIARRVIAPIGRGPGPAPDGRTALGPLVSGLASAELMAAPPRPPQPGALGIDAQAAELGPSWMTPWMTRNRRAIRAALILLAALFLFLAFPVGLILLAAAAGWGAVMRRYGPELTVREIITEESLTVDSVDAVDARPSFSVTVRGAEGELEEPVAGPGGGDSLQAARFREAARDLHQRFEEPAPVPPARTTIDLTTVADRITADMEPFVTLPRRLRTTIRFGDGTVLDHPVRPIAPVMVHPVFDRPMYEPLADTSADLMVPNLHLIPQDTVSLLETNRPFIESYMVGLNHEMARELLWREFPTDQRGSYFRQFWDVADAVRPADITPGEWAEAGRDIQPLHRWEPVSPLGSHPNRPLPTGDDGRVVLLIRGQLLKRYPRTVVFAQRARWGPDPETGRTVRLLDEFDPEATIREPAFAATVEPDVRLVGFDLVTDEVRGSVEPDDDDPGWFFVLQERPGETRFGLDLPPADGSPPPTVDAWDDLAWTHVGTEEGTSLALEPPPLTMITDGPDADIDWGTDAAAMAYILFQSPVMIALHAGDMVNGGNGT